jgi:hypothetical protein
MREAVSGRRWRRQCKSAVTISHPAAWRIPRCFQRGCGFLPGAGAGSVPAGDERSSCRAAAGLAGTRESAPAASVGTCLFRCFFDLVTSDAGAGTCGVIDETLGGPQRCPYRWIMSRHCLGDLNRSGAKMRVITSTWRSTDRWTSEASRVRMLSSAASSFFTTSTGRH